MDKCVKIGRLSIHNYLEENESFIIKDASSDVILFISSDDAYDIIEFIDTALVRHERQLGLLEDVYGN